MLQQLQYEHWWWPVEFENTNFLRLKRSYDEIGNILSYSVQGEPVNFVLGFIHWNIVGIS